MSDKGVAAIVIATVTIGIVIVGVVAAHFLLDWGGGAGSIGAFPSAVGQSLTYGVYGDNNKIRTETLTAIEISSFGGQECFNVRRTIIQDTDETSESFYYDEKGRYWGTSLENMEVVYNYDNGKIQTTCTLFNGIVENEFDMPANPFPSPQWFSASWWGRRDLSIGQVIQLNRLDVLFSPSSAFLFTTATEVTVVREESVTVPAGTFNCYVVQGGATTLWINKEKTIVVKMKNPPPFLDIYKLESYSGL